MGDDLILRLQSRAIELALSPRAVSLKAGMGPTAVRDIMRRPGSSPSTETVRKLAKALEVSPEWLAFGTADDISIKKAHGPSSLDAHGKLGGDVVRIIQAERLVRPLYGGVVEAGSFREVDDFENFDRLMPITEEDPRFPGVPLISFDIAGDSMNALQPTPILPGQRAIGVEFEGLKKRVSLRDGMVVIIEQTLNGGHLRERSVKQLEMHRDRTEFCPRSTNPKHKPIVVPFETVDQGDEDGREVKVLAIVRQVISDLPGW